VAKKARSTRVIISSAVLNEPTAVALGDHGSEVTGRLNTQ